MMALQRLQLLITILCTTLAHAHLAAWTKGMYCINGATNVVNLNSQDIVTPLYQLPQNMWWFHHDNNCDNFPPPAGEFLELPAGKDFTVEIASNRAKTTLAYNGQYVSDWPDGAVHPDNYNVPTCITSPNMHTQNESMAAGTAFAISYQSDITKVTPDNLVVFSVRYHTPWKRITTYSVPAALPACPAGGCICAWGWVPNGCGQPNMYHQPIKCNVTGATSTTPLATPKPPVWCEDDPSKCVQGAKQMIYWNQLSGNNIAVSGYDLSGSHKSPAYNAKCGFPDGAQNDIFASNGNAAAVAAPTPTPSPTPTPNPTPSSTATSSSSSAPPSSNSVHNGAAGGAAYPSSSSATSTSSTPTPTSTTPASHASPTPSNPACRPRPKRRFASEPPPAKKRSYHQMHRPMHNRADTW